MPREARNLLLPRTFLVAMRLQALATLVLVHLKTTFLFEVAHGASELVKGQRAGRERACKARIWPLIITPEKKPELSVASG